MPEGKFDIINVDFEGKKKLDRYVKVHWYCIVCYKMFEYDSRNKHNTQRIIVNDNIHLCNEQCICQGCAIKIKNISEENEWK